MADATPSSRQNGDHLCSCPAAEYDTQLQNKLTALSALIPSFPRDKIEVFRSPAEHFRNRANFNVWKDKRGDTNPNAPYYAFPSAPDTLLPPPLSRQPHLHSLATGDYSSLPSRKVFLVKHSFLALYLDCSPSQHLLCPAPRRPPAPCALIHARPTRIS